MEDEKKKKRHHPHRKSTKRSKEAQEVIGNPITANTRSKINKRKRNLKKRMKKTLPARGETGKRGKK